MRILLLDASHNLEKFSTRVDQLTSGVDQAKTEVISLHNVFRNEHEEITNTIVDLGEWPSFRFLLPLDQPGILLPIRLRDLGIYAYMRFTFGGYVRTTT
jgi:hypothetical protein